MNLRNMQTMRFAVLGVLLGLICIPFVGAQTQTTASITVLGGEQSSGSVWDSGTFTVTVNGNVSKVVPYGQFSTTQSIASGIAALFSRECFGVASAKADGATITFHLRYPGSNISITGGSQRDTAHFSNDSFSLSSQQNFSPSQISLAGDAGGEAVSPGTVIHLSAMLAQSGASGTVSFYDNGVPLGTSVLNGTTASFATPALAVGSHTLYAKYNGDSNYAGSTSNTVYATAANHTGPPSGSSPYWYTITDSSNNSGYAANGNIVAYNDAVMGRWSFSYDAMNHLSSASAISVTLPSGTGPYFCWAYDAFGNRLSQNYSSQPFTLAGGAACEPGSAGISGKIASTYDPSNNNQLTHIQSTATPLYDRSITYSSSVTTGQAAGGYITNDGLNLYLYDGEGRICAAQSPALISGGPPQITQYVYDAEGQRVAKRYVSSWTCDLSQPSSGGAIYINGQGGQITELSFDSNGTSTWVHTNIGAGRVLIATYQDDNGGTSPVTGSLHFALNDWLGTKRMQTSYNGTVENQWSSLPFGDGLVNSGPDATEHHFTGKEHDSESGNDYFPARYYSSSMGRWLSPDWSAQVAPVPYAKLENPQSLNLYSYMLNNPLSGFDPDGHTASCGGDDGSSCKVTMTQITQTVTFHDHDRNGKEVISTVKVVTTLTTISNSNTGAIVSASASATATNVTSNFSSSQLATIGATVAGIQQAGASMALGSNPNQLLTAITAKESTLGIAAPTNPLQLSCSSGTCASGDTGNNIQGALNVLQSLGKKSDYDPASTYSRYNGVPDLDQRRINVNNFMSIYNGMTQSSWGWSPSMPAAPIPPGLQR